MKLSGIFENGGIFPVHTGESVIVTPEYSVGAFGSLPSAATVGQRCIVTSESGLSGLVVVNTAPNTWSVETVTCTYALGMAVAFGATPGQWYSSGGITVSTATAAVFVDTTHNTAWLWDAANAQFVPPMVYRGTVASPQKIKGDALPAGWTEVKINGGGTAAITPSGGKVTISATTSAVATTTAGLSYTDASLSASTNLYFRGMVQATLSGRNATVRVTVWNGANAVDFGLSRNTGSAVATGQWYNAGGALTPYTQQSSAQLDITTAEMLLEIVVVGTRVAARVAGGVWHDLVTSDARTTTSKQVGIFAACAPDTATASSASLTVRECVSMRF